MPLTDLKISVFEISDATSQKLMFRASSPCYGVSKSQCEISDCLKIVIPLHGAEMSYFQKDDFRNKRKLII